MFPFTHTIKKRKHSPVINSSRIKTAGTSRKQRMAKDNKLKTRGFHAASKRFPLLALAEFTTSFNNCAKNFQQHKHNKSPKNEHADVPCVPAVVKGDRIPRCRSKTAADRSHYSVWAEPVRRIWMETLQAACYMLAGVFKELCMHISPNRHNTHYPTATRLT